LGLDAPDADAAMYLVWLTAAFWGAYRLARLLEAPSLPAILAAALWLICPTIYIHAAGYAMLGLGMALLPFYTWCILRLWQERKQINIFVYLLFSGTCIISVFMDGYTYIMFFCLSIIIGLYHIYKFRNYVSTQRFLLLFSFQLISFFLAYCAYAAFIGKMQFSRQSLDVFRAYGDDISYFFIPTQNLYWIWDLLEISINRNAFNHFGDGSIWRTTFILPTVIAALSAITSKHSLRSVFIVAAVVGIYLSLGPTLKFFTLRPLDGPVHMPDTMGLFPTGSALLDRYVPGFNVMRASYRWIALALLGLWSLVVLAATSPWGKRHFFGGCFVLCALIILNLPHIGKKIEQGTAYRESLIKLDRELVAPLREILPEKSRVMFLPATNDFGLTYVAPRAKLYACNIGGDKNIAMAKPSWPAAMSTSLYSAEWLNDNSGLADNIYSELRDGKLDAVIFVFFSRNDGLQFTKAIPRIGMMETLLPVLSQLDIKNDINIEVRKWFAVVTLCKAGEVKSKNFANRFANQFERNNIEWKNNKPLNKIEINLGRDGNKYLHYLYGFSAGEMSHRWSIGSSATICFTAPLPLAGKIAINAAAFGPNIGRPFTLHIDEFSHIFTLKDTFEVIEIPYTVKSPTNKITINIPSPVSPRALGLSGDDRPLGIDVKTISIIAK
jgi:hypothetical protein